MKFNRKLDKQFWRIWCFPIQRDRSCTCMPERRFKDGRLVKWLVLKGLWLRCKGRLNSVIINVITEINDWHHCENLCKIPLLKSLFLTVTFTFLVHFNIFCSAPFTHVCLSYFFSKCILSWILNSKTYDSPLYINYTINYTNCNNTVFFLQILQIQQICGYHGHVL